jgi:hypothetical protein
VLLVNQVLLDLKELLDYMQLKELLAQQVNKEV